jgi:hypothetical protein
MKLKLCFKDILKLLRITDRKDEETGYMWRTALTLSQALFKVVQTATLRQTLPNP